MSERRHEGPPNGQRAKPVQSQGRVSKPSREELLDRLADCLAEVEDEAGADRLEACLDELEEEYGEVAPDFDPARSLDDFRTQYRSGETPPPAPRKPDAPAGQSAAKPRRPRRSVRIAIIAAILICVCVAAVQASGTNLLGMIATWTSEQFHMEREGETEMPSPVETDTSTEYQSLQQALDEYGIEESLAPTYLPEGAVLNSIEVRTQKDVPAFTAFYKIGDGSISIIIRQSSVLPLTELEKDDLDVNTYVVSGIDHYLMKDINRQKAVWYNGAWECQIIGDITRDELTAMIDSIYSND